MLRLCSSFASKAFIVKPTVDVAVRSFHRSIIARGFEEFYDPKIAENELISNGRSWTVPDLRRKVLLITNLNYITFIMLLN